MSWNVCHIVILKKFKSGEFLILKIIEEPRKILFMGAMPTDIFHEKLTGNVCFTDLKINIREWACGLVMKMPAHTASLCLGLIPDASFLPRPWTHRWWLVWLDSCSPGGHVPAVGVVKPQALLAFWEWTLRRELSFCLLNKYSSDKPLCVIKQLFKMKHVQDKWKMWHCLQFLQLYVCNGIHLDS